MKIKVNKCPYCQGSHEGFVGCGFYVRDALEVNRKIWIKNGYTVVSPGIYAKGDRLDFDVPELLVHFGWEDTPENRDKVLEIVEKLAEDKGIPEVTQTHHHRCPRCKKPWLHDGVQCIKPVYSTCSVCNS